MSESILSPSGQLDAVLSQAPMILNDYVFEITENEDYYILSAIRGSEKQTLMLPKYTTLA